jgi:hypothetical protein
VSVESTPAAISRPWDGTLSGGNVSIVNPLGGAPLATGTLAMDGSSMTGTFNTGQGNTGTWITLKTP